LLDFTAPPWAGSRRPGHVEHEKNTFFSLLKNSRSGGGSQGREAPPQRAERSAEPLRTTGAEAIARQRARDDRSAGQTRPNAATPPRNS